MKSINKIVNTSLKHEFESNVENVKNELRKCMSKNNISEKEQHDCYERYRTNIDNLSTKYVPKKLKHFASYHKNNYSLSQKLS